MEVMFWKKKRKVYKYCPHCGEAIEEQKVEKKRVPINIFNSDEVALERDRQQKLKEEAEERQLPGPI